MRLDTSRLWSVSWPPPSPELRMVETVGADSSSETNGSSVAMVAGKKRWPAKPCASAEALGRTRAMASSEAPDGSERGIKMLQDHQQGTRTRAARRRSGPAKFFDDQPMGGARER